ncbi:uncharacterized protein LOC116288973 [Actinia tenebrosa]|uniref:Uncharacterized protein LOC116288973 n=1 Tax=Actinia tenebrosa TaxID=6105 RepID=A0A6P8HGI5_ACTTE|nr:uncharacterized protein LOC116288973 [Actinia tenebrosa]
MYSNADLSPKQPVEHKQQPNFPKNLLITTEDYPFYDDKGGANDFAKMVTSLEIPVGPTTFKTKVKDIFREIAIKHTTGKEAREWLSSPDMRYWPQQLNFGVWAATKGCGIAVDMFHIPFLRFHVAFTIRRILKELGAPLPGDSIFKAKDNKYDKVAWERLKNEFKLSNPDFRNKEGAAHGLGETYTYAGGC